MKIIPETEHLEADKVSYEAEYPEPSEEVFIPFSTIPIIYKLYLVIKFCRSILLSICVLNYYLYSTETSKIWYIYIY